jgi:hypothetical protein
MSGFVASNSRKLPGRPCAVLVETHACFHQQHAGLVLPIRTI